MNKNPLHHIRTKNGQVNRTGCGCCLNISFLNIVWTIHLSTFYLLHRYVKDLQENEASPNSLKDGRILLGMEGVTMMVWVTPDELDELASLLDLIFTELKREEFEKSFVKDTKINDR